MRSQRIITAAVATALLLSGCNSLSLSGPDILAPPKAAGHRAEIQSLIEKDAGGSYALIYPASGSYKSGIILYDTDADGAQEAAALYTAADGTPKLLTAAEESGSYRLTGVTALPSSNVSRLEFADCNGDGKQELLISFDTGTQYAALNAYFNADELIGLSVAEGFIDYVTGDLDGNSAADVLLFKPADDKTTATASLTAFGEDGFEEISYCETDPDVVAYAQLCPGRLCEDIEGVIADGIRDSGEYTTQLIYFDETAGILVNPLYLNSSYAESVRTCPVTSADVDGDDIIEVPQCALMEHGKDEDVSAVCYRARWNKYDPELMALSFMQDSVLCEKLGFLLSFDPDVVSSVTARYSAENAVTLYAIGYKNEEPVPGKELLTVRRYFKNSYDSSLTAEADLYESTAYIYSYVLSEGSPFTNEIIENSFTPLEAESI